MTAATAARQLEAPQAEPDIAQLSLVAARAAKLRYLWADLDDMRQEAALAMLKARAKYDPRKGALEPYLMYAAWFRLRVWIWQDGVVKQRPDRNAGWALRAPVDVALPAPDDPEVLLQRAQLTRAVQQVLDRCTRVVTLSLVGEASPKILARDLGIEVATVLYDLRTARAALRAVAAEHLEER